MFRILIFILAASSLFTSHAFGAELPAYTLVKEKSSLKFYAIQNSAPIEGEFKDFTADIRFDPKQLDQSSVTVTVDTGNISASNEDIATNLKAPEWLSAVAFPKAVFTCKKFTRMPSSDNYYADGTLTIRGKTKPVVLNFQMEHFDDTTAIAKGYVTIRRSDFGVGQGEWSRDDVIKNEVRVEFRILAEKH